MTPSRRRPLPDPTAFFVALVVLACSRLLLCSSVEAEGFEGAKTFFDARLAEGAAALSPLVDDVNESGGGGGAKPSRPQRPFEPSSSSSSLDVGVFCEPDRFLPAKRMPATVSLPRLVARVEGGSCRLRGGGGNGGAAGFKNSTSSPLSDLARCSPGRTSWFYQEPLLLPERETPAALFAGSCSLSLLPSSMKRRGGRKAEAMAAAEAATTAANNGISDDTFIAVPPLASSNVKRVQVLSPVVVRCESLEAMKRGECSVVEVGGASQERKKKKEKRRSRKGKEAVSSSAAAGKGGDDFVLPSAGAVAVEVGKEVYEALRAF